VSIDAKMWSPEAGKEFYKKIKIKKEPHLTFTFHPFAGFLHFLACGVIWPT